MSRFRRASRGDESSSPAEPAHELDAGVDTVTEADFMGWTTGDVTAVDSRLRGVARVHALAPMFEDATASLRRSGARFGRCDVDENPEIAAMVGVMSIPTVVVFDPSGNEVDRVVGLASKKALDRLIERGLGHAQSHDFKAPDVRR